MPSNRSTKARRASASDPAEMRALEPTPRSASAQDSSATPIDGNEEPAGLSSRRRAIEQVKSRSSSPGAVGPIGRTVLLIALFTLAGLGAVWVLLVL
jgi:hypothetical protein